MARFTFLLPAFKSKFLACVLKSIAEQTYSDFRVVVSDDCSPESIKEIFDKVCGNDNRFYYRRNSSNLGGKGGEKLTRHWNYLLEYCDSEYVILASDDDVYAANFLEEINQLIKRYPDVYLFRARVQKINEKGDVLKSEVSGKVYFSQMEFMVKAFDDDFIGCISNYVFKAKTLKDEGGFVNFPAAWFSDYATVFKDAKNGCCMTSNILFSFRISTLNITNTWGDRWDSCLKMQAICLFYKWQKKYLNDFSLVSDKDRISVQLFKKEVDKKVYTHIMNYIFHCQLFDFVKYLFICPNNIGLHKHRMLFHYIRYRLQSKFF